MLTFKTIPELGKILESCNEFGHPDPKVNAMLNLYHPDHLERILNLDAQHLGALLLLNSLINYDLFRISYVNPAPNILEGLCTGDKELAKYEHPAGQVFADVYEDIFNCKQQIRENLNRLQDGMLAQYDITDCEISKHKSRMFLTPIARAVAAFFFPIIVHTPQGRPALLHSKFYMCTNFPFTNRDLESNSINESNIPCFMNTIEATNRIFSSLDSMAKWHIDRSLFSRFPHLVHAMGFDDPITAFELRMLYILVKPDLSSVPDHLHALESIDKEILESEWAKFYQLDKISDPVSTMRRLRKAWQLRKTGIMHILRSASSLTDTVGLNQTSDLLFSIISVLGISLSSNSPEYFEDDFSEGVLERYNSGGDQ